MIWYGWRPYVPVAVKRARSLGKMEKLRKKGLDVRPVSSCGREIARTFWGRAWCDHLEKFSDYANRLPRGRSYVRNGLVCHLEIAEGSVKAIVSGSDLYNVEIDIKKLPGKRWSDLRRRCAGQIGSLLELLQGRLSKSVMSVVTDRDMGLFPLPSEIKLQCDCPDWAVMCKHVAAVLYGVGARLDEKPELLFHLRGVDHEDLIGAEVGLAVSSGKAGEDGRRHIAEADLSDMFGIEISDDQAYDNDGAPGGGKPRRNAAGPKKKARTASPTPEARIGTAARPGARTTVPPALSLVTRKQKGVPKVAVSGSGTVTGAAVAKLRSKFKMSPYQFARLIGVCTPTVSRWEEQEGVLHLQGRTREAWNLVSRLGRREAFKKLKGKPDRHT
jgi:uncharacterized Zn finger protein